MNDKRTISTTHSCSRVMRGLRLAPFALAAAVACSSDHEASNPKGPVDHALKQPLTKIMEAHHASSEFPGGVVALVGPDGESVMVSVGTTKADPASPPLDPNVPMGIGSVTKTFLSVVTLQLAEEGQLALDDTIEGFYPDLPRANEITIRHLLRCESGLNDHFNSERVLADSGRPWSPDELVEVTLELGAVGEPGERYFYSNTGYVILGEIIEEITGKDWVEQMEDRIIDPLAMSSTGYMLDPTQPSAGPGYGIENGEFVDHLQREHPTLGGAAGGLQSTAADLLVFTEALFEGDLLSLESMSEMRAMVPGEQDYPVDRHEYGLGMERYVVGAVDVYGHMGISSAHSAFIGYNDTTESAVVVLLNCKEPGPQAFIAFEAIGAALEQSAD